MEIQRNPTRSVRIGSVTIGAGHPIAVQSMTATHTQDIDATVGQVNAARTTPGPMSCGSPSIARRTPRPWPKSASRRRPTSSVDLQENYRLAELVAPHVDKVRYNPGHLYHHERDKPWQEKVRYLADVAARQRLRDARRRQLRQRRSGQAGEVRRGRLDHADARKRARPLRAARRARLHALLRLAQGFRSARR